MKIGILGAGNVGTALGAGWAAKGHAIAYGVREPAGSAPAPHPGARRVSVREAVAASELVVLATPWDAVSDALDAAGDFGGKILVDATNPIGPGFSLAVGGNNSGGEEVARRARNARVAKSFHTTGFETMADPRYGAQRAAMFVAADDATVRATVAALASELGFEPLALPALARARDLEPLALLWVQLSKMHGRGMAFGVARRTASDTDAVTNEKTASPPRRITVVGAGNIGGPLAAAWLRVGHTVRLAVRDAGADDARVLGALGATVVPLEGAAEGAEVVVLAVPHGAVAGVLPRLGALHGRVLVDCTNALGPGMVLTAPHGSSAAEQLAVQVPGAHVVKSFNQQGAETLRAPRFGRIAATNFVAGDDEAARRTVLALAADVGLDAVDAGPLARARSLEHETLVWITASQALGTRDFALALLRR